MLSPAPRTLLAALQSLYDRVAVRLGRVLDRHALVHSVHAMSPESRDLSELCEEVLLDLRDLHLCLPGAFADEDAVSARPGNIVASGGCWNGSSCGRSWLADISWACPRPRGLVLPSRRWLSRRRRALRAPPGEPSWACQAELVRRLIVATVIGAHPHLMATSEAAQSRRWYVSQYPNHRSLWSDMLSRPWVAALNSLLLPSEFLYCFPAERLILQVLQHIEMSRFSSVLLVVPAWSRAWIPALCRMCTCRPIVFGEGTRLLILLEGGVIAGRMTYRNWSRIEISYSPDTCPAGQQLLSLPTARDGGRGVQTAASAILPSGCGLPSLLGRDIESSFSRPRQLPTLWANWAPP
jgi:hypothetical protein